MKGSLLPPTKEKPPYYSNIINIIVIWPFLFCPSRRSMTLVTNLYRPGNPKGGAATSTEHISGRLPGQYKPPQGEAERISAGIKTIFSNAKDTTDSKDQTTWSALDLEQKIDFLFGLSCSSPGRRIGERRRRRQKNDTKASTQAIPDHRHGGFDLCSQRLAGLFFTRLLLLKASQL